MLVEAVLVTMALRVLRNAGESCRELVEADTSPPELGGPEDNRPPELGGLEDDGPPEETEGAEFEEVGCVLVVELSSRPSSPTSCDMPAYSIS